MKSPDVCSLLVDLKKVFKKHDAQINFDDGQHAPENTRMFIATFKNLGTMDYQTIVGNKGILDADCIQWHIDKLRRQK